MSSDLRGLPTGTRLSDYRLERVLGHGGFGITYLATDLSLDQKVAIKEYYPREFAVRDSTKTIHATGSGEDRDNFAWGLDRFREEAKTLARFSHPNVVAVRRLFEANGTSYIVMDFCEGAPLDQIIKRDAPLSKSVLEGLFMSLLDGLEHIHAAGVMHRDIKPANIFIRADGSPVLLDFGAARQALVSHSRSMTSLATAHYAAFEQYSTHGKQGAWTDIYGLAATLYHAATGEKPKDSPDRILEDTLEPLATKAAGRYARDFLRAIDAGMAVRPENRPQTVREWRSLLGPISQKVSSGGAPVEMSQGETSPSKVEASVGAEAMDTEGVSEEVPNSPHQEQRSVVPVSLVVILVLIIALFASIFAFAWKSHPASKGDAETVSMYVSGRANARDQPSAEGSSILGTYDVGTLLSGTWVNGATDANERWLKFEADGKARYIWDGNLSAEALSGEPALDASAEAMLPDDAIQFVKMYVDASKSSSGIAASDFVASYYAETVDYFGGTVVRSQVADEKIRYVARWPERNYQIMDETLQTDCSSGDGACLVSGEMWYSATSEARGAHGEGYAEFTLGVKKVGGDIRIIYETSKVIRR